MNAGAFGTEIGDKIEEIYAVTPEGKKITLDAKEARFGYRVAEGIQKEVVTGILLSLEPGEKSELEALREEILRKRKDKQPLNRPSCGSVFKRPAGDYAGRLIESAGLMGKRIGDAAISDKHANFILNMGNATAADIYQLIVFIRKRVYEEFGVLLEPEVQLIGFEK